MANSRSAKKRIRKTIRQTKINLRHKNRIKTLRKKITKAITGGDIKIATDEYPKFCSTIDKAAKKNIIHSNKSDRLKRNLAKLINKSKTPQTS